MPEKTMDRSRRTCSFCASELKMRYIFPAELDDACEESHAWRFQHCMVCGWVGDVVRNQRLDIGRDIWHGYRIDGRHYDRLRDYLVELELCSPK